MFGICLPWGYRSCTMTFSLGQGAALPAESGQCQGRGSIEAHSKHCLPRPTASQEAESRSLIRHHALSYSGLGTRLPDKKGQSLMTPKSHPNLRHRETGQSGKSCKANQHRGAVTLGLKGTSFSAVLCDWPGQQGPAEVGKASVLEIRL